MPLDDAAAHPPEPEPVPAGPPSSAVPPVPGDAPLPASSPDADAPVTAVLPQGWTIRPPRFLSGPDGDVADPDDVALALDTVVRTESFLPDGGETTAEEIASMWAGPEGDRAGSRLVLDGHGRAAAVTLLECDRHGRRVFLDVYADADHPGAPADLPFAVARGAVVRAGHVAAALGGPWTLEAGSYEVDTAYNDVLARLGLQVARRFYRMRLDLGTHPAVGEPATPPGAAIEVAASEAQRRVLHDVVERSFAAHWGHARRDFAAWEQLLLNLPGADPSRWWLARVDGEPAAACILDDSRLEAGDGYVRTLGVLPRFRGRGLARWLLRLAFNDAATRGLAGVQLGVDAANETGATQLYESVGMHPTRVMLAWQSPLA